MHKNDRRCSICGQTEGELLEDHYPETGKVKGILCERCVDFLNIYKWDAIALNDFL
jgi:hypothetical protein